MSRGGAATPRKALALGTATADVKQRTLKRSEAHEGMNPLAQASGERRSVATAGPDGNGEDEAGAEEPNGSASRTLTIPWRAANLMRGSQAVGDGGLAATSCLEPS